MKDFVGYAVLAAALILSIAVQSSSCMIVDAIRLHGCK